MIAHCEWMGGNVYKGIAENGNSVFFDVDASRELGPNPLEALLMALCACAGTEVVAILEAKRLPLVGMRVTACAEQTAVAPREFTRIKLTYVASGRLHRKTVQDAVALARSKHCPVAKMMEKAVPIEYEIVFEDSEPE